MGRTTLPSTRITICSIYLKSLASKLQMKSYHIVLWKPFVMKWNNLVKSFAAIIAFMHHSRGYIAICINKRSTALKLINNKHWMNLLDLNESIKPLSNRKFFSNKRVYRNWVSKIDEAFYQRSNWIIYLVFLERYSIIMISDP